MQAIQIKSFGEPSAVLEHVELPEPPAPAAYEILLGVEYSPLNVHDLHVIRGHFFFRPELPGVVGNEGVGTVLAVGPGVDNVAVGDRVLAPLFAWSWRERLVVPATGLVPLPAGADPMQLSMLGINPPSAALMLSEFTTLEPGDWVVQNSANSGVGRSLIAIAKQRGLQTINIVRRAELVDELEQAGADLVFVDGPNVVDEIKAAIGEARVPLGVDGIGGAATGVLAKIVTQGGWITAYAFMSWQAATLESIDLISKRIKFTGFFLGYPDLQPKIPATLLESAELIAEGKIHVPIAATYPLSAIHEAVAHVERGGKVLLEIGGSRAHAGH